MIGKNSIFMKFLIAIMVIVLLIIGQSVVSYYLFERNGILEEKISGAQQMEISLLEKEIDHHLWMIRLYDMFAGGEIPAEIKEPTECALGQWYYDYDPPAYLASDYKALETPHDRLHNSSREVVNLYRSGQEDEALQLFRETTLVSVDRVVNLMSNMIEAEKNVIVELEKQMERLDTMAVQIQIWSAVISVLMALVIAIILTKVIVTPIADMSKIAQKIADGDLTKKIDLERNDEIGVMAKAFNSMINKLKNMVKDINDESEKVVEASTHLKVSADETGKTAEEIAQSMLQVAEGNDDTSQQVTLLDDISRELRSDSSELLSKIDQTVSIARKSESTAREGQVAVNTAIEQLDTVHDTVTFATDAINKLGKRSAQIGEMVQLIDGIASQTNLLALNAAIEAARAGEHGSGFAVVAEEVRQLAEESSEAAGKITSLIEDIESETTATVNSMNVNAEEVGKQVKIINKAGSSLQEIVEMSGDTRGEIEQIKDFISKIKEQSMQMNNSVDSIAAVVEENAASSEEVSAFAQEQSASVEEISASADELDDMAHHLQQLIKQFKIKED